MYIISTSRSSGLLNDAFSPLLLTMHFQENIHSSDLHFHFRPQTCKLFLTERKKHLQPVGLGLKFLYFPFVDTFQCLPSYTHH